jgi:hypothetical protein
MKSQSNISSKDPSQVTQKDTPDDNHTVKYLSSKSYFNINTIVLKSVQLNSPFPKELELDEIINYYASGFLEGFAIKDNEGVFCKNEEIVKKQSGIITDLAKQLAKGIFSKGVVSMSLPIRLFEPRSMLERYSDWWCYAPILLRKAGASKDKLQAFKYVIAFVISSMYLSTSQMKPFNPLLGETYEGCFDDGTKIYLEHTSHIPCISNYLIKDPEDLYQFSGFTEISVEGTMKILFNNSVTMVPKGKNTVYLKTTNQTISFQYPKILLGGMVLGSRYVLLDGFMKFEDRENKMKAVIYFNRGHPNLKLRRIHDFYGQIYYHDFSENKKKEKEFYEEKTPKNPFPSDKKNTLSEINGSWLENIIFDNEIYWSMRDVSPPQIIPQKVTIPSDARYREDLIWLKKSILNPEYNKIYEDYAQKWKLALEVQQRHDRSLREKKKKK